MSNELSRRAFFKEGAKFAGAVGFLSLAPAFLTSCGEESFNQAKFFQNIEGLSPMVQAQQIDKLYGGRLLDLATASQRVLPVWAKLYTELSGSNADPNQLVEKVHLNSTPIDLTQGIPELGTVKIQPVDRTISDIDFNLGAFPSNKDIDHPNTDEVAKGIVYQRSGLIHEFVHHDTGFVDNTEIGRVATEHNIMNPPIPTPEVVVMNGFVINSVNPDQSFAYYFNDFDEAATDVISTQIATKACVRGVMLYDRAAILRGFLEWVGYTPEEFMKLHRESNLQTLASQFGELSLGIRKQNTSDQEHNLVEGLNIVKIFNNRDLYSLEDYYPGISQQVINQRDNHRMIK